MLLLWIVLLVGSVAVLVLDVSGRDVGLGKWSSHYSPKFGRRLTHEEYVAGEG